MMTLMTSTTNQTKTSMVTALMEHTMFNTPTRMRIKPPIFSPPLFIVANPTISIAVDIHNPMNQAIILMLFPLLSFCFFRMDNTMNTINIIPKVLPTRLIKGVNFPQFQSARENFGKVQEILNAIVYFLGLFPTKKS